MISFLGHQTQRQGLIKFFLLLLLLVAYFAYLVWHYGMATGGGVLALTWSFFVLCTPIADAGFLIDFPIRLIMGVKMFLIELFVWGVAAVINITTLFFFPDVYEKTVLTFLFHKILTTPWPYWSLIILCAFGTFLSIRFGDEMFDVVAHRESAVRRKYALKYKIIVTVMLLIVIVFLYYHLLETLGVQVPTG